MYSNGRIYVDTSVTPNVGVSIGDLQQCFNVVIKATIGGETVRRLSSDLGVIIAKTTEDGRDSISDGGVTWRVESRQDINPWARYRPIPCATGAYNTPSLITPEQRRAERYGIDPPVDMFTADEEQAYMQYANGIDKYGAYYLKLRPFGDSHWKRLSDFAKTDEHGITTSLGYDHNARMDEVIVKLRGDDALYTVSPLISEGERDLYLPNGEPARFQFPNDQKWVDEYFKHSMGRDSTVEKVFDHEEWLSPMDLIAASTYYDYNRDLPQNYTKVLRGVLIFKRNQSNTAWQFVNKVRNFVEKENYSQEYNSTTKTSFLDLTRFDDGGTNNIDLYMFNHPELDTDTNATTNINAYRTVPPRDYSGVHDRFLWNLEGRYLFVEFWQQSNSSVNMVPIPGMAYEVNIHRQAAPPAPVQNHAYIIGVFEFQGTGSTGAVPIEFTYEVNPDKTFITFAFLVNPSTFLHTGDVINNNDSVANAMLIMSRLQEQYSSFYIKFYDSQSNEVLSINLLTEISDVTAGDYTIEGVTWKDCSALIHEGTGHLSTSGLTAKAFATIRSGSIAGSDELRIGLN